MQFGGNFCAELSRKKTLRIVCVQQRSVSWERTKCVTVSVCARGLKQRKQRKIRFFDSKYSRQRSYTLCVAWLCFKKTISLPRFCASNNNRVPQVPVRSAVVAYPPSGNLIVVSNYSFATYNFSGSVS